MLLDPRRYGVINIRVWQLLHSVGAVTKSNGVQLQELVSVLNDHPPLRAKHAVRARDVERGLFLAHKDY
jgi:hypothetical protein